MPTQKQLDDLGPWFQRIEFPDGKTVGKWDTPGLTRILLNGAEIIARGARVLEVGAMSGGMTKVLEQDFDAEVTAIETDVRACRQFELVAEACDLTAELIEGDILDVDGLEEEWPLHYRGPWPVAILAGVYYHSLHPIAVLDATWKHCTELMIVEGWVIPVDAPNGRDLVAEWVDNSPGAFFRSTGANWWRPSVACLYAWAHTLPDVRHVDLFYPSYDEADRAHLHVWRV